MELSKNINKLMNIIPENIKIVAATKYVEAFDMKKLLEVGINNFGENRVDSFLNKYELLKDYNIYWHFIGHLQTNKAKHVLPKLHMLHSLDSIKLAEIIEKTRTIPLDCFIEININGEEQKNGISPQNLKSFLEDLKKFKMVHIVGLMMMTTKVGSKEEKYNQFLRLKKLKDEINPNWKLSMGMTDDYEEAIRAKTSYLRLGRILWEMN